MTNPQVTTDAELSKLLFEAREIVDMYHDILVNHIGPHDSWTRGVRDRLDAYRAERGWSPDGFGDE